MTKTKLNHSKNAITEAIAIPIAAVLFYLHATNYISKSESDNPPLNFHRAIVKWPRDLRNKIGNRKIPEAPSVLRSNTFGVRQYNLLFCVGMLQLICLKCLQAVYQLRVLPLLSYVYVSNSHIFIAAAVVFIRKFRSRLNFSSHPAFSAKRIRLCESYLNKDSKFLFQLEFVACTHLALNASKGRPKWRLMHRFCEVYIFLSL